MKTLCILGRQSEISLAELESLYGGDAVTKLNSEVALLSCTPDFSRLGGTQKIAQLFTVIPQKNWNEIERYLVNTLPTQLADMPDRKIHLGFSVYGMHLSLKQLQKTALTAKKALRSTGRSVRVVPNKHLALSSAQVFHNHFTDENGAEIIICKGADNQLYIGKTTAVQDIDAYTARDQQRPKRDAKVGMLPPKLAQTIVNLAVGQLALPDDKATAITVLDPFCGTGVIAQETVLMNYAAYGSDIEQRMIDYTEANLAWLTKAFSLENPHYFTTVADATTHTWGIDFTTIAGEAYLGRPFATTPDQTTLKKVMQDVDTITSKFFKNVTRQTKPGFRLCIAVPAWHVNNAVHHLKTLASLEKLGYTRQSFVHAKTEDLIYRREGQIVARELLVLTRT